MKTILVIDDDFLIRLQVGVVLRQAGQFRILTAKNGSQGSEIACEAVPDLIISDYMMPEVDGLGLLTELSHNPLTADIPVIFISGCTDELSQNRFPGNNILAILSKPFDEKTLTELVLNNFILRQVQD